MAGADDMGKYKRMVSTNELKAGMIIASDIMVDGKILVGMGVAIAQPAINKLREGYFLNKVEVYCEEDEADFTLDYRDPAVKEVEESFTELAVDMENIFENIEKLQSVGIEEVRNFAKTIQEELESTSAVIKNIVLYGSGSDAIYRHSVNVAALSAILGKWVNFDESEINQLTYAAILHDFGKVKIDKRVLEKPGPLSTDEFKIMKNHVVLGYNYVKDIPFIEQPVTLGALMHHERVDGSGYPFGIKQNQIHPYARIIAIADVFDAVNSNRVYKKSKGPFEALEIIQKESLGKLDYEYSSVFLNHVVNYYMGESVILNTGEICKIIKIDVNDLKRPLLLGDSGFLDLKKEKHLNVESLVL